MALAFFVVLALLLLAALIWLLQEKPAPHRPQEGPSKLPIEELFPLHCRHFPQVKQALSPADEEYLRKRASPRIRRESRAERRKVTRQFVAGLKQDFSRLDRLGRTVAALAPQVSREQETERFWLGLRFRALYQFVQVQLLLGGISVPQLARLTELVGSLAVRTEAGMAVLEEASVSRLRSSFSS